MSEADKEEELVQEARIALLKHYSSKSTNQATIILTVALAFFAFVQTLQFVEKWPDLSSALYISYSLTFLLYFALRAIGRLIYWGTLAGEILVVTPASEEPAKQIIKDVGKESKQSPTIFMRLLLATGAIYESRFFTILNELTNTRWAYVFLPFIASALLLCFHVALVIQIPHWVLVGIVFLILYLLRHCKKTEGGMGHE